MQAKNSTDSRERKYAIYLIRNMVNGKVYVGQTIMGIVRRWQAGHICEANRGRKSRLANAIRKYGSDSFRVYEIAQAETQTDLDSLETALITAYQSDDAEIGYNILRGGQPHPMEYPASRQAVAEANRRRVFTPEHRAKLRERPQRPITAELGAKISQALKGRKHSEGHRKRSSEVRKGKPVHPNLVESQRRARVAWLNEVTPKILEAHGLGLSNCAAATAVGVHRNTVAKVLAAHGIHRQGERVFSQCSLWDDTELSLGETGLRAAREGPKA